MNTLCENTPTAPQPVPLYIKAKRLASELVGEGETPGWGNNRGEAIDRWMVETGLGKAGQAPKWCSLVQCHLFKLAAGDDPLPFELHLRAKRFGRNVGRAGQFIEDPVPGALIVWARGMFDWQGHIELCKEYELGHLVTYSGNTGPSPQLFRERTYGGEWRKNLAFIALAPAYIDPVTGKWVNE